MRLNKFQKAWIARLKSGKTRKAKNKLNNDKGGMCCLGVGIKICGLEDILTPVDRKLWDENLSQFPKTFKSLNLRGIDGEFDYDAVSNKWIDKVVGYESLAELNDGKFSHVTIGEFIDENREAVFRRPIAEKKAKKR